MIDTKASSSAADRLGAVEYVTLLALFLGLAGGMAYIVITNVGQTEAWFGLFCLTLLLCVPLLVAVLTRRFDPFAPIHFVFLTYFLYFVYGPAKDLATGRQYLYGIDVLPLLPRGSLLLALGLVALLVGYYGGMGRSLAVRLPRPYVARRSAAAYGYALAVVGILMFALFVRTSGMSILHFVTFGQLGYDPANVAASNANPFQFYFYFGIDLLPAALLIALAHDPKRRRWIMLGIVLVLIAYITIGFRYRVLVLALGVPIFFYLRAHRRPRLWQLMIAGIVLAIVIGGIARLRYYFRTGTPVQAEMLSVGEAQQQFFAEMSLYQPYLALLHAFPTEHDYLWGRSFAHVLVHPIPRRLWTTKPEAPVREILRAAFDSEAPVQAGVAYPNIGEYYVNFGLLGVVAGMFLTGLMLRALYEYLLVHRDNDWVRILFALALPFLVQFVSRGYFVQIVQEAMFFFGPIFFGMWLLRTRGRATRPVQEPAAAGALPETAWALRR